MPPPHAISPQHHIHSHTHTHNHNHDMPHPPSSASARKRPPSPSAYSSASSSSDSSPPSPVSPSSPSALRNRERHWSETKGGSHEKEKDRGESKSQRGHKRPRLASASPAFNLPPSTSSIALDRSPFSASSSIPSQAHASHTSHASSLQPSGQAPFFPLSDSSHPSQPSQTLHIGHQKDQRGQKGIVAEAQIDSLVSATQHASIRLSSPAAPALTAVSGSVHGPGFERQAFGSFGAADRNRHEPASQTSLAHVFTPWGGQQRATEGEHAEVQPAQDRKDGGETEPGVDFGMLLEMYDAPMLRTVLGRIAKRDPAIKDALLPLPTTTSRNQLSPSDFPRLPMPPLEQIIAGLANHTNDMRQMQSYLSTFIPLASAALSPYHLPLLVAASLVLARLLAQHACPTNQEKQIERSWSILSTEWTAWVRCVSARLDRGLVWPASDMDSWARSLAHCLSAVCGPTNAHGELSSRLARDIRLVSDEYQEVLGWTSGFGVAGTSLVRVTA